MTALPEDVKTRAKAAAHDHYGGMYSELSEEWAYEHGYLACYTAERPRIELAALEAMVPHTCCFCAGGGLHGEQYDDGTFRKYECFAAPLHARIAELRAEIEKGER